jgi:catechol 2,3-dioxygenase-like lactoylglutathione lyase family enzyme
MGSLKRISSIGHNCLDAMACSQWYQASLGFESLDVEQFGGVWLEELLGLPSAALKRHRMRLGQETLELWQFDHDKPEGIDLKDNSETHSPAGNDSAFQHICIVTPDLAKAFNHGAKKAKQISSSPQRLPDWNPGAAGILAVKFQDPDGHPLELLQFPADKGNGRWHQISTTNEADPAREQRENLFLGLDHTAISVADTERSLHFYGTILGMKLVGQGHNYGPEQDGMDGLHGTDVLISSLHGGEGGMGIELLHYRKPEDGIRPRANPRSSDLDEWRICAVVEDLTTLYQQLQSETLVQNLGPLVSVPASFGPGELACLLRDPDGHALLLFGGKDD